MATITTGVLLMRWPLLSAVLMFLASTLHIQFRRSDYQGLTIICNALGIIAACWFATGLLGISQADIASVWENIKTIMVDMSYQAPPQFPVM